MVSLTRKPASSTSGGELTDGTQTVTGDKTFLGSINAAGGGPGLNPTGTTQVYTGSTAPNGFLLCDGAAVSRTTYADLFAVVGTTYGIGDGSTTFNLPGGTTQTGWVDEGTDFTVTANFGGNAFWVDIGSEMRCNQDERGFYFVEIKLFGTHSNGQNMNILVGITPYGGSNQNQPLVLNSGSGSFSAAGSTNGNNYITTIKSAPSTSTQIWGIFRANGKPSWFDANILTRTIIRY